MIFQLTWSTEAKGNYRDIVYYLLHKWTTKEVTAFRQKINRNIRLIAKNPLLFAPVPDTESIHRAVINRQVCMYYKINGSKVVVLYLFDNRQDPKKLRLRTLGN